MSSHYLAKPGPEIVMMIITGEFLIVLREGFFNS